MKKIFKNIRLLFLSLGSVAYAQTVEPVTVNQGQLYILPNTLVYTQFDFDNTASGIVFNDGEFQFYKNYNNDGLFTHTSNQKTGYTVFQGDQIQLISGSQPSKHFDVLFNNNSGKYPFNLNSDMIVDGVGNFRNGIVKINEDVGGKLLFGNGSSQINANDNSYAEGTVEKQGNNAFTYPVGANGYYRPAAISAPDNELSLYHATYYQEATNNQYPHKDRAGIIREINDNEYWYVNKSDGTNGSVILSLSWHDVTTPATFKGGDELHIVRWDDKQNLWVDEGGIVDANNKTVTSPVAVEGFGIFTLGTIKKQFLNPGDVVVYQGVSPDNDGVNDYLIIDNIHYFPENTVTIFNRWGRKVYETTGYDTKGNVFNGVANISGSTSTKKLPTGTYYYVIEYLYDRDGENQWIKKVGYFHLENNN